MASVVLGPVGAGEVVGAAPHWGAADGGGGAGGGGADEIERLVREPVAPLLAEPPAAGPVGPGRPRVLPALALWAGLLVGVLRGYGSQQALWRLLTVEGLWDDPRFPVGDEAVRQRLAEGGPEALAACFRRLSAVLAARLAPSATEVVALDGSARDPLARLLPACRASSPGASTCAASTGSGACSGRTRVRTTRWPRGTCWPAGRRAAWCWPTWATSPSRGSTT